MAGRTRFRPFPLPPVLKEMRDAREALLKPMDTLESLANYLGKDLTTVGHYETGRLALPDSDQLLRKWLRYLAWPPARLEELRKVRRAVRMHHVINEDERATPQEHAALYAALWRDIYPLPTRPPLDRPTR